MKGKQNTTLSTCRALCVSVCLSACVCVYLYICSGPSVDTILADPASWFNTFTPWGEQHTHAQFLHTGLLALGISCQILCHSLRAATVNANISNWIRHNLAREFYLKSFFQCWSCSAEFSCGELNICSRAGAQTSPRARDSYQSKLIWNILLTITRQKMSFFFLDKSIMTNMLTPMKYVK